MSGPTGSTGFRNQTVEDIVLGIGSSPILLQNDLFPKLIDISGGKSLFLAISTTAVTITALSRTYGSWTVLPSVVGSIYYTRQRILEPRCDKQNQEVKPAKISIATLGFLMAALLAVETAFVGLLLPGEYSRGSAMLQGASISLALSLLNGVTGAVTGYATRKFSQSPTTIAPKMSSHRAWTVPID